jgi:hypothetical protein
MLKDFSFSYLKSCLAFMKSAPRSNEPPWLVTHVKFLQLFFDDKRALEFISYSPSFRRSIESISSERTLLATLSEDYKIQVVFWAGSSKADNSDSAP